MIPINKIWANFTVKVKVKSLSHGQLFATPWTVAHHAPPSMGFSRQESCSGLPFSSPGGLPDPGTESSSPELAGGFFTTECVSCVFLIDVIYQVVQVLNCYGLNSGGSEVKASASNAGDLGSIPGSGRSPGEGNGNPLQDSCLENPMDGGVWWATVHGVAKSRT